MLSDTRLLLLFFSVCWGLLACFWGRSIMLPLAEWSQQNAPKAEAGSKERSVKFWQRGCWQAGYWLIHQQIPKCVAFSEASARWATRRQLNLQVLAMTSKRCQCAVNRPWFRIQSPVYLVKINWYKSFVGWSLSKVWVYLCTWEQGSYPLAFRGDLGRKTSSHFKFINIQRKWCESTACIWTGATWISSSSVKRLIVHFQWNLK